jgi:tetratricopeptide (TPR) repeat protein
MKSSQISLLVAGVAALGTVFVMQGIGSRTEAGGRPPIAIDYPLNGSVFPRDIAPPTFLWRDPDGGVVVWRIEVSFGEGGPKLKAVSNGEMYSAGVPDPECVGGALPELTPEQKVTHTWKPDAAQWAAIKSRSEKRPAVVTIAGYRVRDGGKPVSSASVTISTSRDPVGAPIFYRDVPLMLSPTVKGVIQPLPPFAVPLIKWRLRNIAEPQSRVVMQKVPTCINCHSFTRDGKTLGLDVDGPQNDKGLYALVPVARQMTIGNQDVIRWSSFAEGPSHSTDRSVKRFGFMSQISPDGKYVVTSIGPPGLRPVRASKHFVPGIADRLFNAGYKDFRFGQVFYPTRGILAWYDREEGTLKPLPGADDPRFVQTSAFWSPDGKYLVFSRALARDPYTPGATPPEYANDPNETQIQYDLYRIPFNNGRGGVPERIVGASEDGKSNNFPKVSPDGKWIVFVECKNGLLMRPDSRLYIVPFEGGTARPLRANMSPMNSWHSFSPNGRWLVFSSKSRTPYTQMFLTHLDEQGNDTPAILIENSTAANRAVNIPEFVNIPEEGIEKIDPQATEFYRIFNIAMEFMQKNQMRDAIPEWRRALQMDSDDGNAHYNLAYALADTGDSTGAVAEYRKAVELIPDRPVWYARLALVLARSGDTDEAIANYRKSVELDPDNAAVQADFGVELFKKGLTQEALDHLKKSVEIAPEFADGQDKLGTALAKAGQMDEAVAHLEKAVDLSPKAVEYRFNLGYTLGLAGRFGEAIPQLEKAVDLSGGKQWQCLAALGAAYSKAGRPADAVSAVRRALDLAVEGKNDGLARNLRAMLERYEQDSAPKKPPTP